MADEDLEEGTDMAEQDDAGQDHAAVDPGQGVRTKPAEPGVSSPELDHLQHTIDDARDAAQQALGDQPDV